MEQEDICQRMVYGQYYQVFTLGFKPEVEPGYAKRCQLKKT